jgi:hypothetical protein
MSFKFLTHLRPLNCLEAEKPDPAAELLAAQAAGAKGRSVEKTVAAARNALSRCQSIPS